LERETENDERTTVMISLGTEEMAGQARLKGFIHRRTTGGERETVDATTPGHLNLSTQEKGTVKLMKVRVSRPKRRAQGRRVTERSATCVSDPALQHRQRFPQESSRRKKGGGTKNELTQWELYRGTISARTGSREGRRATWSGCLKARLDGGGKERKENRN